MAPSSRGAPKSSMPNDKSTGGNIVRKNTIIEISSDSDTSTKKKKKKKPNDGTGKKDGLTSGQRPRHSGKETIASGSGGTMPPPSEQPVPINPELLKKFPPGGMIANKRRQESRDEEDMAARGEWMRQQGRPEKPPTRKVTADWLKAGFTREKPAVPGPAFEVPTVKYEDGRGPGSPTKKSPRLKRSQSPGPNPSAALKGEVAPEVAPPQRLSTAEFKHYMGIFFPDDTSPAPIPTTSAAPQRMSTADFNDLIGVPNLTASTTSTQPLFFDQQFMFQEPQSSPDPTGFNLGSQVPLNPSYQAPSWNTKRKASGPPRGLSVESVGDTSTGANKPEKGKTGPKTRKNPAGDGPKKPRGRPRKDGKPPGEGKREKMAKKQEVDTAQKAANEAFQQRESAEEWARHFNPGTTPTKPAPSSASGFDASSTQPDKTVAAGQMRAVQSALQDPGILQDWRTKEEKSDPHDPVNMYHRNLAMTSIRRTQQRQTRGDPPPQVPSSTSGVTTTGAGMMPSYTMGYNTNTNMNPMAGGFMMNMAPAPTYSGPNVDQSLLYMPYGGVEFPQNVGTQWGYTGMPQNAPNNASYGYGPAPPGGYGAPPPPPPPNRQP